MEEKKDLIKCVTMGEFGVCPICDHKLNLVEKKLSAYTLSESGWITSRMATKTTLLAICPNCGYELDMLIDENGLYPAQLHNRAKPNDPILHNPLGE